MNEITTDHEIEEAQKKLAHDMADLNNPATRELIRELFREFMNRKEQDTPDPAPNAGDIEAELKAAVSAVLHKHKINHASVNLGVSYNASSKEEEPESGSASEQQAEEHEAASPSEEDTAPAPEDTGAEPDDKEVFVREEKEKIIEWAKEQLIPVPCAFIKCDDCPVFVKVGRIGFCMRNEIIRNINSLEEKMKKEASK